MALSSPLASVAQGAGRSAIQFGNGFLLEFLKSSIRWRTVFGVRQADQ